MLFHFLRRCWLMKWIFLNLPFSLLTGKPGSPVMNEGSFSRFCCKNKNKNKKLFYNAWPQKKQLLGQKIDFKIFNPLFCLSATIRQKNSFFFNFCFRSKILTSWFSYRGKSKSYVFIQQIKRFEWTFFTPTFTEWSLTWLVCLIISYVFNFKFIYFKNEGKRNKTIF